MDRIGEVQLDGVVEQFNEKHGTAFRRVPDGTGKWTYSYLDGEGREIIRSPFGSTPSQIRDWFVALGKGMDLEKGKTWVPPEENTRISHTLSPGELDSPSTVNDILSSAGHALDHLCPWDAVGRNVFILESGEVVTATIEVLVVKAGDEEVTETLDDFETDEGMTPVWCLTLAEYGWLLPGSIEGGRRAFVSVFDDHGETWNSGEVRETRILYVLPADLFLDRETVEASGRMWEHPEE